MKVFSLSIKYFKERLLRQLDKSKDHCSDEDIRWVLTVPAIWGEQAKQLMQESAEMVNFSITFIQVTRVTLVTCCKRWLPIIIPLVTLNIINFISNSSS